MTLANDRLILDFCSAKMCSMWARAADFLAWARAVRAGIGRRAGFLRSMRLVSIRWRSSASFFLER